MARYAGVQFDAVSADELYSEDGILLITESQTGKKFVMVIRARSQAVPVSHYNARALASIGADKAHLLSYELYKRVPGFTLERTLERVKTGLRELGLLWQRVEVVRQNGVRVDLNTVKYYIYAMRHKTLNTLFIDFDFYEKKLKDPMGPKAVTYNGLVKRGVQHTNKVMHEFAVKNFPINPDDWSYCKIVEEVLGVTKAKTTVGQISADLMRQGVVVLNCVHGIDPVSYRNHRLPLPKISVENYLKQHPLPRIARHIEVLVP